MLLVPVFLAVSLLVVGAVGASKDVLDTVGIRQSLTQNALKKCVEVVAPAIASMFNTFTIPDATFTLSTYVFTLHDIMVSDVNLDGIFATLVDGVGISGGCNQAALNVQMSFSFYQNGWPYSNGNGYIKVSVSDLDLSAIVSFHLDTNYTEYIDVESVSASLKDMDIHIGIGGSSGSLINTIIQLLKPVITNLVETSLEEIVQQAVKTVVSSGMQKPTYYRLEDNVLIDIREFHAPSVSKNAITANIVGAYSGNGTLQQGYEDFDPPPMPSFTGPKHVQVFISYDSMASLWHTFLEAGYFKNIEATFKPCLEIEGVDYIVASGSLDKLENFKPMYAGFYAEISGQFTMTPCISPKICKKPLSMSYKFGIAHDPGLKRSDVTKTQIVGMEFFFDSLIEFDLRDAPQSDSALYPIILWINCLQPFLNNWGRNNGYPLVIFTTMLITNEEFDFRDGHFYVGGDLEGAQ